MRRIISLLVVFVLVFSMIPVSYAVGTGVALKVDASKETVLPGEEITFNVKVSNPAGAPITAIGFRLNVPADLAYVSHTDHFPEFYEGKTEADGTENAYNYESNYNTDAKNYAAYGDTAVTDAEWTVLSITYKVSETASAGALNVNLERDDYLSIGDSNYESVEFTAVDGSATVLTAVTSPVEIGGLVAPVKGEEAVTEVTLPSGMTGTLTWKNGENVHTGTFEPGTAYVAEIAYTVADGYALPADVEVTTPEGAVSAILDVANSLIKVTYPMTGGVISGELTVNLTAPVTGAIPQTAVSGESYTGTVTWEPADSFFADKTAYTATVVLNANEGYLFAENVTVAGIDTVEVAADGSTVTFTKVFEETGAHPSYYWTFDADGNPTSVTTDGFTENVLHADKGWDNGELTASGMVNGSLAMTTPAILPADEPWTIEWKGGITSSTAGGILMAFNDYTGDASGKAAEYIYVVKNNNNNSSDYTVRMVKHGTAWSNLVGCLYGLTWEQVSSPDTVFYMSHDGDGNLTIAVDDGTTVVKQIFTGTVTKDYKVNSVKGYYTPKVIGAYGNQLQYVKLTRNAMVKEITGQLDLGIAAPVSGATPVTGTDTADYGVDIVWNGETPEFFAEETVYTAAITLTAADNVVFAEDVVIAGASDTAVSEDGKTVTATISYAATEKISGYYWDFNGNDYTYVTGNGFGVNELTANAIVAGALDMARPITLRNDQAWTIEWKGGFANTSGRIYGVPLAYNTADDTQGNKDGAFIYVCNDHDREDDTNKICVIPAGASDSHGSSIISNAVVNDATVRNAETVWNISYDGNGNMTITVTVGEEVQTVTKSVTFTELTFNGVKGYLWNNLSVCADDSMDYMKITFKKAGIGGELDLGLTAPVSGAAPETSIECDKYTGTIVWNDETPEFFAEETEYTANITLTAADGEFFAAGATVKGATNAQVSADGKTLNVSITYAATEKINGYYWDFDGSNYEYVTGNGYGMNALTPNAIHSSTLDLARDIVLKGDQPWTIEWKGGIKSSGKLDVVPLAYNTSTDKHPKTGAFIYITGGYDGDYDNNTNKICVIPANAGGSHSNSLIKNAIAEDAIVRSADTIWTITYDGNGTLSVILTLGDSVQAFRQKVSNMPDLTFNGVKGYLWANNGYGADDTMDYMKITYNETELPFVASVENRYFLSLEEAIAACPTATYPNEVETATTITLLKDVSSGFDVGIEAYPYETEFKTQNIVLDLNGHTLTLGHPPVGSDAILKTHGLRVLAHSKLTIKSGVVVADSDDVLNVIANYGTLSLNNVKVLSSDAVSVTVNNRGALTLEGATEIENGKADEMLAINNIPYQYPEDCSINASLTVNSEDVVVGDVFVDLNEVIHNTTNAVNSGTVAVNIPFGTFGAIMVDGTAKVPVGNITGGTFTAKIPQSLCAPGYMSVGNGNGQYTVVQGASITGSVTSYGKDETAVVTIELISDGDVVQTQTVVGKSGTYTFKSVVSGAYTIRVSKEGHVAREYEITVATEDVNQNLKICLKGDVTGDGKINVLDVNKLFGIVNQTVTVDDYVKACGEVTNNNKLNVLDVNKLFRFINQQIDAL